MLKIIKFWREVENITEKEIIFIVKTVYIIVLSKDNKCLNENDKNENK